MANEKIVNLKGSDGNYVYPVTTGRAVLMEGDKNLDTVFQEKTTALQDKANALQEDFAAKAQALGADYEDKKQALDQDYITKTSDLNQSYNETIDGLESWKTGTLEDMRFMEIINRTVTVRAERESGYGSNIRFARYTLPEMKVNKFSVINLDMTINPNDSGYVNVAIRLNLPPTGKYICICGRVSYTDADGPHQAGIPVNQILEGGSEIQWGTFDEMYTSVKLDITPIVILRIA